jgi:hypothetical protein
MEFFFIAFFRAKYFWVSDRSLLRKFFIHPLVPFRDFGKWSGVIPLFGEENTYPCFFFFFFRRRKCFCPCMSFSWFCSVWSIFILFCWLKRTSGSFTRFGKSRSFTVTYRRKLIGVLQHLKPILISVETHQLALFEMIFKYHFLYHHLAAKTEMKT